MRNKFEQIINGWMLDAVEVMNRLQSDGVISDNAVTPADVPDMDRILEYCFAAGIIKR